MMECGYRTGRGVQTKRVEDMLREDITEATIADTIEKDKLLESERFHGALLIA